MIRFRTPHFSCGPVALLCLSPFILLVWFAAIAWYVYAGLAVACYDAACWLYKQARNLHRGRILYRQNQELKP